MKPGLNRAESLFRRCAWEEEYECYGRDVNAAFRPVADELIVFFQGSKDIRQDGGWIDWLRNAWFFPKKKEPYKGMAESFSVHSGFLAAWKEIEDEFVRWISSKKLDGSYEYSRITIVGYSHGGALSCLAHECAWFHRPDIRGMIETYSFEAPMAYAGLWVKESLRERWSGFLRFENGWDLVTKLPPRIFGFCGVGERFEIQGDPGVVEGKLPKCLKRHFPECVLDGLRKAEEESGEIV